MAQNWLIRIIDEVLPDGFFDKLKKTGLKVLAQGRGKEKGIIHFQGMWFGTETYICHYIKTYSK